jgi:hypothetical protein
MTDKNMTTREMVIAAVEKLNELTTGERPPEADFDERLENPFTAVLAETWEAIEFIGYQVWCRESDQCDTPDDGETVESIVAYVVEFEMSRIGRTVVVLVSDWHRQNPAPETP